MDLRSLRHLVVLARRLSYTKAAEELGLSQSALSRSIQAVEARAKVRLFDRDRGGVHMTSVGRAVADRATVLLREADDLERMLARAARGAEGEISFGMAPLPAAALLPATLAEALAARPQLVTQAAVRSADALLALLLAEKIEFFVCAEGQISQAAPVKAAALGVFPSSLIVRPRHPLLAPDAQGAIADYPLAVSGQLGEHHAPAAQVVGPSQVVLEDYGALARLTQASDAIWLSSTFAVAEEIRDGRLVELPAPPGQAGLAFRMILYSLDRRSLSPAALWLKDQFRTRIRELSELVTPNR
ncbi:LysR family transcriptional regulator [Phenylobacterium sp. LjRoot219]|uniref:LysR family transcriptional regulator n=1 Tax=Phenylobacterium sp. LjRoot219 TaxID=3342283 RepID=UPI003ECE23C7